MASSDGKRALPQEANGGHQQLALKKQRREDGSALAVSAKKVEPEVCGARPGSASTGLRWLGKRVWACHSALLRSKQAGGEVEEVYLPNLFTVPAELCQTALSSLHLLPLCWSRRGLLAGTQVS